MVPVDILSPASSSSDEEGSSSDNEHQYHQSAEPQEPEESEESEGSDDDEQHHPPQNQEAQVTKEYSYDDSDDSDDSLSVSAYRVQPILPKYVSKSPQSKSPVADSQPYLENEQIGKEKVGNNGKRPVEVEKKIDKVSKNKKIKVCGDGVRKEDEGPQGEEMRRGIKWREDDEIVLLDGIIDFKAKTGEDVNSKMVAFYQYVKDLLSVMFTRSQVYEKIRRLKKKFEANHEKCKNGKESVFSRPHENKLFEISQKIWGSHNTEGNDREVENSMNKDKIEEIVADKEETPDFLSLYPRLCASLESESCAYLTRKVGDPKEFVKKIIIGLGEEKARELEEECKAISVMDHQVYARRTYLISELANFVLDWLKHDVEKKGDH